MKKIFSGTSLDKYNQQIKKLVGDNEKVNHIEIFLAANESKLSIVAQPNDAYVGKCKYFGAHPCISEKFMLDFFKWNAVGDPCQALNLFHGRQCRQNRAGHHSGG